MASGVPALITFATVLLAAVAKDDFSESFTDLKLSPTKGTTVKAEDGEAAWSEKEMQEKREAWDKKFATGSKAWEKTRAWAMEKALEKEASWGTKEVSEKAAWAKKMKEEDFWQKKRAWAKKEMAVKEAWAKKMPEEEVWKLKHALAKKEMPEKEAWAEKMKETSETERVWKRGMAQQAAGDEKINEMAAQQGLPHILEKQWAVKGMFGEEEDFEEVRRKKRLRSGSQDYARRDHVHKHHDARANYEGYGDVYGRDNEVDMTYDGRGDDTKSEEKYGHHSHGHDSGKSGHHSHGLDRVHRYMDGKHHRHANSPVAGKSRHRNEGHRGLGYGDRYDDVGGDDDESGYGYGSDGEADVTFGHHSQGHGHEHGYLRGKHYGHVQALVGLQKGIKGLGIPLSMVIGFTVLAVSFAACLLFKGIDKLCAKRRNVRMVTADGVLLSTTSPSLLNEEERTERREGQAAASSSSA
eukprot:TRINITY_DN92847_c0_g1_i1.p1 TRINITY_DN92847_c0_g1~~TRINITY_DN92847_c0_g1_i1.p1  ORF type:complete len:467 (+),score=127.07 TRINITY_DN92847_c0_g1_i1:58-1458(+)